MGLSKAESRLNSRRVKEGQKLKVTVKKKMEKEAFHLPHGLDVCDLADVRKESDRRESEVKTEMERNLRDKIDNMEIRESEIRAGIKDVITQRLKQMLTGWSATVTHDASPPDM